MKDYIGHHTCKTDGGSQFVLENAPFISKYILDKNGKNNKLPFLGTGYYFWEYDLKQAKKWGKDHYSDRYFILEALIHTTNSNFLDLVGDRKHIEYFLTLARKFVDPKNKPNEWKIGKYIEIFKRINRTDGTIFPYDIIRAQDYNVIRNNELVFYFRDLTSFTYLDPRHIFCVINVNHLTLSDKKIVFLKG